MTSHNDLPNDGAANGSITQASSPSNTKKRGRKALVLTNHDLSQIQMMSSLGLPKQLIHALINTPERPVSRTAFYNAIKGNRFGCRDALNKGAAFSAYQVRQNLRSMCDSSGSVGLTAIKYWEQTTPVAYDEGGKGLTIHDLLEGPASSAESSSGSGQEQGDGSLNGNNWGDSSKPIVQVYLPDNGRDPISGNTITVAASELPEIPKEWQADYSEVDTDMAELEAEDFD